MEGNTKPKTFVRGGVIQRGTVSDPSAPPIPAIGTEYRLEPRFPQPPVADSFAIHLPEDEPTAVSGVSGVKKTRELDSLLEELKSNPGAMAVERDRNGAGRSNPVYIGDSEQGTTNLYVGNLAPSVTEEALSVLFGRFGPLLSVKVMWPRSDEERARARNTGFVMFSDRSDAEAALASLQGREIEGKRIELGWARAVRAPANAYGSTAPRAAVPGPVPPPPSTVPQHLLEKLAAIVAGTAPPAAPPQPVPEPIEPRVQPQAKVPATTTAPASNQSTSATASTPSATLPASAAPGT